MHHWHEISICILSFKLTSSGMKNTDFTVMLNKRLFTTLQKHSARNKNPVFKWWDDRHASVVWYLPLPYIDVQVANGQQHCMYNSLHTLYHHAKTKKKPGTAYKLHSSTAFCEPMTIVWSSYTLDFIQIETSPKGKRQEELCLVLWVTAPPKTISFVIRNRSKWINSIVKKGQTTFCSE